MDQILKIIDLLNAAEPGIAKLVLIIARKDGTVTLASLHDETEAQFDANVKQVADWLASKKR